MTSFAQQKVIQSATRKWLASSTWINPYAVTLNLKLSIGVQSGPLIGAQKGPLGVPLID